MIRRWKAVLNKVISDVVPDDHGMFKTFMQKHCYITNVLTQITHANALLKYSDFCPFYGK